MNKYQEALEFLRSEDVTAWGNDKIELLYFYLDIIEELVDKATPKKPIPLFIPMAFTPYRCSCCNALVNSKKEMFNYCPNCGQKIYRSN